VRSETHAPVPNRGAITISIMLTPIMQGVDTTIANVALPHMQGSLSASQDQIAWVLTFYIVAAYRPVGDSLRFIARNLVDAGPLRDRIASLGTKR